MPKARGRFSVQKAEHDMSKALYWRDLLLSMAKSDLKVYRKIIHIKGSELQSIINVVEAQRKLIDRIETLVQPKG